MTKRHPTHWQRCSAAASRRLTFSHRAVGLALPLAAALGGSACSDDHSHDGHTGHDAEASPDSSSQGTSKAGLYQLAWTTTPAKLEVGSLFALETTLRGKDGALVEGATLKVDAWMPAHNHGMEGVAPITAALSGSPGVYRTTGMRFQMPGQWELLFEIEASAGKDSAALPIAAD